MNNFLNPQHFHVIVELKRKVDYLVEQSSFSSSLLHEIVMTAAKNIHMAEDITGVVVDKAKSDASAKRRSRLIYVIDALIRQGGCTFIHTISPFLIDVFSEIYRNSPEDIKISLFKCYYTWKHIINPRILEHLAKSVDLRSMKTKLEKEQPDLIRSYDTFNEEIREKIQIFEKETMMVSAPNEKKEVRQPVSQSESSFKKKEMKESFLKTPEFLAKKIDRPRNKKQTKDRSDDLFSSDSGGNPRVNSKRKGKEKREEAVPRDLIDMPIKKKKKKGQHEKQPDPRKEDSAEDKLVLIENLKKLNPNMINTLKSNPSALSMLQKQNLGNFVNDLLKNPNLLNVLNPSKAGQQAAPKKRDRQGASHRQFSHGYSIYNALDSLIERAKGKIRPNMQFFSSISKAFKDTLKETDLFTDLLRSSRKIKAKTDILKVKDLAAQEEYRELINKEISSLQSPRNQCAMCGFRTKFYSKYLEHLDVHFYLNYLKRNSKKKVVFRREGLSKSDWINTNYNATYAFTLNALLFYHHDADHFLSNKQTADCNDNKEDDEQLIYPLQESEMKCAYCGEDFTKKYLSKYHFWFYVNVVKFNQQDLSYYKEYITGRFENLDFVLIHELCVEEFFNMLKSRGGNIGPIK